MAKLLYMSLLFLIVLASRAPAQTTATTSGTAGTTLANPVWRSNVTRDDGDVVDRRCRTEHRRRESFRYRLLGWIRGRAKHICHRRFVGDAGLQPVVDSGYGGELE
jgi:hypothetical protein